MQGIDLWQELAAHTKQPVVYMKVWENSVVFLANGEAMWVCVGVCVCVLWWVSCGQDSHNCVLHEFLHVSTCMIQVEGPMDGSRDTNPPRPDLRRKAYGKCFILWLQVTASHCALSMFQVQNSQVQTSVNGRCFLIWMELFYCNKTRTKRKEHIYPKTGHWHCILLGY